MFRRNTGFRAIYRIVGDGSLHELRPQREWSLATGVSTTKRFGGPAEKVAEYFNELMDEGGESGVDHLAEVYQGQKGELVIHIVEDSGGIAGGNTEELNAVWELVARELLLPIESHPGFDAIVAERKREIEKAARAATVISEPTAAEKKLYAYYSHNVLDYLSTDLMLAKTTTLSNRSLIQASYANLNTVVTIEEINPPLAIFGALTTLPRFGDPGGPGDWEWLKLGPAVRQVTETKYQLSYRWHGASRWADIYGGTWIPKFE